jgi:hypothetical protein
VGHDAGPDDAIRDVVAKQQITEALMRYCRGVDRGDIDLVMSAFHDGALDDHHGVDEIAAERFPATIAGSVRAIHRSNFHLGNVLIEVDGEVANSESYVVAHLRLQHDDDRVDWTFAVRYVDRFERRAGVWRIARRTVVFDWERFDEVRDPPDWVRLTGFFAPTKQGQWGRDDFSYQRLGSG